MSERFVPRDILHNILIRLPAPSLQRFKSVSKEWLTTISDQEFAEAHLAHQSQLEFGCGFITAMRQCVLFMGGTSLSSHNPPHHISLHGAHHATWVHGSCKGLVLFHCTNRWPWTKFVTLYVANPIMKGTLTLPPFYRYSSLMYASIACVRGREIKVAILVKQNEKSQFVWGILTLGSSTWRVGHVTIPGHQRGPFVAPILVGSLVHWSCGNGILTLDLVQEKFHQTDVNFCDYQTISKLMEWDGCLAIVCRLPPLNFCSVWILRDSGWTKLRIGDAFFDRMGISTGMDGLTLRTSMRNGEVLLFSCRIDDDVHLLAYDLHRQVLTNFTQFDVDFFIPYGANGFSTLMAHVNSMISTSIFIPSGCTAIRQIGATQSKRTYFQFIIRNLFRS